MDVVACDIGVRDFPRILTVHAACDALVSLDFQLRYDVLIAGSRQ